MNPLAFLQEVKAEVQKVTWPTKQQAIQMTILVIAVSMIVGAYIGSLDFTLTNLINQLIK